jgi:hypothetical protein
MGETNERRTEERTMTTNTKTRKTKHVARTYSDEQNAYMLAVATVGTLDDAARAEMASLALPMGTEEQIDAYCDAEESIRTRLGVYAAYDRLGVARAALFSWGHEQVKSLPGDAPTPRCSRKSSPGSVDTLRFRIA